MTDLNQQSVLVNAVVIFAVLAYVLRRQFSTRPLTPRSFLLVTILFLYGLTGGFPTAALGVALLLVSVIISIVFGAWRGTSMRLWRAPDGVVYRRGTVLTITLWSITVAAKLLLDGYELSATHTLTTGPLWLAMAVTLAVQQAVMHHRSKSLTTA